MCRFHMPSWVAEYTTLRGKPLTEREIQERDWLLTNYPDKLLDLPCGERRDKPPTDDEVRVILCRMHSQVNDLRKTGVLAPVPNLNDPDFDALVEKYRNA